MGEEDAFAVTPIEEDPWAEVVATEDTVTEVAETPETAEVVETLPAAPAATTLFGVSTEAQGEALSASIQANGTIDGATWFTLEDPDRLVVDLPGLTNQITSSKLAGDGERIAQIRIGQHDSKVRVVLDAAAQSPAGFETVELVSVPTGLWVGVNGATAPLAAVSTAPVTETTETAEVVEEAPVEVTETTETMEVAQTETVETAEVPAAMDDTATAPEVAETTETTEEVAETTTTDETGSWAEAETTEVAEAWSETETEVVTEEAAPAEVAMEEAAPTTMTVYGVQLENEGGQDRVVIVTDGPAEYVTTYPSADTTVVTIRGATIDADAAVRIVPDVPGTVSLVTAFQQPEAREPEVRVVIRGLAGSRPAVDQQGAMLFLAYQATEQPAPVVPMLSNVSTAGADAPPAAIDPSADSVEILTEGGLVDGKTYTGRRISLDFKDVEIDDVLRLIAEVSDLNIIAGDEVNGKVTIRLVDVPWDQALDVILLTRGLGFVRVGSVLRIAPSNTLKAEEEARLQERRAKEKLEDLVVKLQPVNYADVEDVEKMVKRLLTARGSVDVDERTNTVILKDIASVIDEATALIKAIDTQTPQVMIEAKIVEANLDFGKELGAIWALGIQPFNDGFDPGSGLRTDERLGLGNDILFHENNNLLPDSVGSLNNVAVANPISSLATGLINLGTFILDERINLEAQIQAAESYGEGKVVSSPRIVTLDNRKASIEQGVSIPFQTFENGDAKLEFIDAVLRLDVTPHITADRSIIMKLEVQRNAPDDSVQTPTGSPAIAKNEAETETLVKDGQTLVIGGIYVVDQSDLESRVPYFHKIPLLGNAFKNTEVRDIRKELLVFVTPRIVVNPELGS